MIEVTCRYDDAGSPVLVVSGPLRDDDLPIFRTVLDGALEGGHRTVTVDLTGASVDAPKVLRHCTSVGARLERAGRRLALVGALDARVDVPARGSAGSPAAPSPSPVSARVAEVAARSQPLRDSAHEAITRAQERLEEVHALRSGLAACQVAILRKEVEGLRAAMASRATIEQAKGIVMGSVGCDADHAFQLLVQQSQHENRKLRDVAAELVARQSARNPLEAV